MVPYPSLCGLGSMETGAGGLHGTGLQFQVAAALRTRLLRRGGRWSTAVHVGCTFHRCFSSPLPSSSCACPPLFPLLQVPSDRQMAAVGGCPQSLPKSLSSFPDRVCTGRRSAFCAFFLAVVQVQWEGPVVLRCSHVIHRRRVFAKTCVLGPPALAVFSLHIGGMLCEALEGPQRVCPGLAWECVLRGSQQRRRQLAAARAWGFAAATVLGVMRGDHAGLRPCLPAGLRLGSVGGRAVRGLCSLCGGLEPYSLNFRMIRAGAQVRKSAVSPVTHDWHTRLAACLPPAASCLLLVPSLMLHAYTERVIAAHCRSVKGSCELQKEGRDSRAGQGPWFQVGLRVTPQNCHVHAWPS